MVRIFLSLCLLAGFRAGAQADSTQSLATVNVLVTSMAGQPSAGEEILFRGQSRLAYYSGVSDAKGMLRLRLPVGDTYTVTVKSLTDSSKYGTVSIPALEPGEFYTEPFKVNVKFDPARTYTLRQVHFDVGKASLRPESMKELEELVRFLKHKPGVRVEIGGHTDNVGQDKDNLVLSQQRAETIRNWVIRQGINATRVQARGYGAAKPVADNGSEEGRQLNRRTEVRIL